MPNYVVSVKLSARSYPIVIGSGLLSQTELFTPFIKTKQVMIVSNEIVAQHYLAPLQKALQQYQCDHILLPDGEENKTVATWYKIFDALMQHQHDRGTTLIALGGGVIGDMTGFAAACYQRGVNFLQVPTTLLAQVDASIGGKTAINHELGKNMIGAFYQPQTVIIDTDTLITLPDREFKAGLAEVVKHGLIQDVDYFIWLEKNIDKILQRDSAILQQMIKRSCEIKAAVVSQDETEQSLRAILNFGHTFAHAIETGTNYERYLHGEAVAIGMVMAAELSQRLQFLAEDEVERIRSLLPKFDLPITAPETLSKQQMIKLMQHDKKVQNQRLRFIVLDKLGHAVIKDDISEDLLC